MKREMVQDKIYSGCAIAAIMDKDKNRFCSDEIVKSIARMRPRSNGLGGGFAGYGIYPEHKEDYALHIFAEDQQASLNVRNYLDKYFELTEERPFEINRSIGLVNKPELLRFFVQPTAGVKARADLYQGLSEKGYIFERIMEINSQLDGVYIVSSGKNMGIFKGLGYPEEVAEFYRLDQYSGYLWTAHGRFPTNTAGWWAGAHPFGLLGRSVVHNGEISSYGTNKRYVEIFDYKCSMATDTEVIAYLLDLLIRRQGISERLACQALAAPLWDKIARLDRPEKELLKKLRIIYSDVLLNGPFSVIIADNDGLIVLNDRIKLRPMVVAEKGNRFYAASEESAIRGVETNPDRVEFPAGGEPVIEKVEAGEIVWQQVN
ncbi:MAG: hypothetical protein ABR596_10035 [Halarsenatibacteraceae bacterium]